MCVAFASVSYSSVALAVSDKIWVGTTVEKVSEGEDSTFTNAKTSCPAEMLPVFIEGWNELREACVYGGVGKPQLARYVGSSGFYLYAIKFPLDTKFIPIRDMCLNSARCAYGQSGDVLLMQVQQQYGSSTALIEGFTRRLKRYTDDGVYFRFENSGVPNYISFGSRIAKTNAVAVSPNGRWAVVELEGYGFVRVNVRTGEYKRVIAPGAQYGYGNDPSFEISITDDGTKIAIAGWRASVWVYEVNDECGDRLTDMSTLYFSPYVYACEAATIDVYGLFPGFMAAYIPRFSSDGTRLTAAVQQGQQMKKATIAPAAYKTAISPEHGYVTFGDSFTSGEGELSDMFYLPTTNTSENRCHVSTRSYPYLIGAAWGEATTNNACSGARIANVREASRQAATQPAAEAPRYISIGVGGNDIDIMGKLKTCLGPGTCEWASVERRKATRDEIQAIFPQILKLTGEIGSDNPGATMAIVGYPSVVNTDVSASCSVLVSGLLNSEERRYMDESVQYLNKVLRAAANYAGISYIDIEDSLLGERLCDKNDRAMNSVRLGDDIAPVSFLDSVKIIGAESFHPTPRGHQMISAAIQAKTGGSWWGAGSCSDCQFNNAQLTPSSYWSEGIGEESHATQRAELFLSATDVPSGASISFTFPSGSFAPGSSVVFELHSTPQTIAEYTVADDGSLEGVFTTPYAKGYHTLHALGQSFSGEATDVYETIAIGMVPDMAGGVSTTSIAVSDPISTSISGKSPQMVSSQAQPSIASVKGLSTQQPFMAVTNAIPVLQPATNEVPKDYAKILKVFSIGIIGGCVLVSVGIIALRGWKKRSGG